MTSQSMLHLKQIRVLARIGCLPWEQNIRQPLYFDISWPCDVAAIAEQDDLANTVDYTNLVNMLKTFLDVHHFQLIESLAYRASQHLKTHFKFQSITVSVTKPNILPNVAAAVVECYL